MGDYCSRGFPAPGKFTLDSVRLDNNNGTLRVKDLILSFILLVAGQAPESHPHLASLHVTSPFPPLPPHRALGRALCIVIVNNSSLPTCVQVCACEH